MRKSTQITFIVLFLIIIFTVPIVQTVVEYSKNEGHHIQMLDLLEDIFLTPAKKANTDARLLDTLRQDVSALHTELVRLNADTSAEKSTVRAEELCDESLIKITLLKQSVINYNRHLAGDKNKFAKTDTLQPYYQSLTKIGGTLEQLTEQISDGEDVNNLLPQSENLSKITSSFVSKFAKTTDIAHYYHLTLTALNRIMVGADYLRPYEKDMENSSVFTIAIRPWLQAANYGVYGYIGNKGLTGTDGWYYYRTDVDYLIRPSVFDPRSKLVDANDVSMTENIVDSVVAFKNQLAAKNIDLLFILMPTKPSVYPEHLSRGMKPMTSGYPYNSLEMMDSLEKAGVKTINLFAAFEKERANDAAHGDSLYMHTDTHFKLRGIDATARTVAERIRQFPWFKEGTTDYVADTLTIKRMGDIAEMTNLPDMTKKLRRPDFPMEEVVCAQVHKVERDSSGAITQKTLYKDDIRNSEILILGDSFSRIFQTDQPKAAGWISHLAKELKMPVSSIVNDGGASTLVRQVLARKPQMLKNKKLVVWQIVERDVRFGAEGWKNVIIP